MATIYILRPLGGTLILTRNLVDNDLNVTWVTRDKNVTWVTRDKKVTWVTRSPGG